MDTDEQILSQSESPNAYNVETISGSLCRSGGYSIAKWQNTLSPGAIMYTTPAYAPLEKLFVFRNQQQNSASDNLIAQVNDFQLIKYYSMPEFGIVPYNTMSFEEPWLMKKFTYLLNYRLNNEDCAILGGPEAGTYTYKQDEALKSVSDHTPWLTKAVMHYERLFGVGDYANPKRIWFSAQGDPTNFTVSLDAAGYIDLMGDKGNAKNIVVFADSVFIFWQYGITKVSAYNLQSEFTVTDIYTSESEILPDSVVVCGRQIIFATRDGIFSYNGSSVSCISNKIRKLFDNNSVSIGGECSIFYRSKYYLSLRLPLNDESTSGNNAMLEYDTERNRWRLFKGCTIKSMCITHDFADEKLILVCENDARVHCWDGSDGFAGAEINACWDSPSTDLGAPNAIKELRELHVTVSGSGILSFTMRADGKEQTKKVTLKEQRRIVKLKYSLRGKLVALSITNEQGNAFVVACPLIIYTQERD